MKIVLSQTASWNPKLVNGYRTRYTTAGGRYFEVTAEFLYTPWFIHEITEAGDYLDTIGCCLTLAEARTRIAAATEQEPQA